jgi:outer membrane protein OmpA-like peptidoglycan-associated protein
MGTKSSKVVFCIGLMGLSAAALAGATPNAPAHPSEPVGFLSGAIIGGFAAGPIGAVVGAGLGTWLGNRVHRSGEATRAEAQVAKLQQDTRTLQAENSTLAAERSALTVSNQELAARLDDMAKRVETAQNVNEDAAQVLDGLQGDVLFRTGSADITPDLAHQIQAIAQAVSKSGELKIRVDGYADPRGTDEINMKLSQDRANAVRDLLVAAGVKTEALEVNAFGKTQSVASDSDGYALERRVRLTLKMEDGGAVARNGSAE